MYPGGDSGRIFKEKPGGGEEREYDMEKHMRMEREDAREDGIHEGIQKGIQTGIFENRTEIIQKMLSLKRYSYEEIAEIVNLSVEEIHEIEDQNLSRQDK